MELYGLFVIFILCGPATAPSPYQTKQYRSDYVYNKKTDAFYKLHIEGKRGWQVQKLCEVEGAKLMVPTTQLDIIQLHSMFKRFPDLGNYVWVAEDGHNHESAEEQPLIVLTPNPEDSQPRDTWHSACDVVTRTGEVETYPCYRELPFICKVDARDAPYDNHCGVYARDYEYIESVGSCYKIPRVVYPWNQAYAECQAEGAHLVVINSEAEMLAVKNIINTKPSVLGATTSYFFFAGFRAEPAQDGKPKVFKTIFNQTLEEAGYSQWSPNEPNNFDNKEDCGTLFKNDGNFNDVICSHPYAFICEKEVHL
ncbi:C-type lectin domain family 4 member M [Manduca sexta]|uniref:IML1 n=1 Tax=Manduca sexta TaxID=7130 RepID=D3YFC2_MANSE|nr:C-type lectin domain family 4 member M [Manduca sexta]ADD13530.1 IML1 [Manduca sexta]